MGCPIGSKLRLNLSDLVAGYATLTVTDIEDQRDESFPLLEGLSSNSSGANLCLGSGIEIVGGTLRLRGRCEDRAGVALQRIQPYADIVGMVGARFG